MGNAFFFESRKLNGNSIESLEKLRHGSLTANYLQIACKEPVKNLKKTTINNLQTYLTNIISLCNSILVPSFGRIFVRPNLFFSFFSFSFSSSKLVQSFLHHDALLKSMNSMLGTMALLYQPGSSRFLKNCGSK